MRLVSQPRRDLKPLLLSTYYWLSWANISFTARSYICMYVHGYIYNSEQHAIHLHACMPGLIHFGRQRGAKLIINVFISGQRMEFPSFTTKGTMDLKECKRMI